MHSTDGYCKVWKMIIVGKVGIYDNDVGYNSKTEGYTTFMLDINKLAEMHIIIARWIIVWPSSIQIGDEYGTLRTNSHKRGGEYSCEIQLTRAQTY